jgi:hypothetical protein
MDITGNRPIPAIIQHNLREAVEMEATVTELAARRAACETVAGRIAGMIRGADPYRPIPGSEWTVGEAAAHLTFTTMGLAMMARGLAIPYGDGTREGLAEANDVALEGFSERNLDTLATGLIANTRMAFDEAEAAPAGQVCPTPMGDVGIDGLTGYVLTHQAMHGSAIAEALRAPLPFDADHVELMWPFIHHVLGKVALPARTLGLHATFEVRFTDRFGFAVTMDNGSLRAEGTASGPVDCEISGDAQMLFLVLVKILDAGDALQQGALHLSGPRAELGLTLMDFFSIP